MTTPQRMPNRRSWLKGTAAMAAGGLMPPALLQTQTLADADPLASLNRFPRMVQEYYVSRVREMTDRTDTLRASIQSAKEAHQYVETVRRHIRLSFGPSPEKTPLNARITGVLERPEYRVEKLLFESRPGFLVTANLYVPKGVNHPMPGVIATCGHSSNGKAEPAYQSFCQGLARMGYVVLIYDPIGQGERLQYVGEDLHSKVGVGVAEHLMAGNQQFLVNEFIGSWRAWDGIRALDYLLTREEVDPRHIGVTGNSGGGTMTTWLCGLDERWTMAAPSCFVTTFRRNLENELPADTEQCPPRAIALGVDHVDCLAAMAPRPIIILAKEKDYFDVRGATRAYEALRQIYRLMGAEDQVSLFVGPTGHGFSQENREAMYGWFNRAVGKELPSPEKALRLETEADLLVTQSGQVSSLGSRTVHAFTAQKAAELEQSRQPLSSQALQERATRLLQLPVHGHEPYVRILRARGGRGYPLPHATTYVIETEPSAQAIAYRLASQRHDSRPTTEAGRAILYVSHHSADQELRSDSWVRGLVPKDSERGRFYACDVRGVGESRPDTCGENSFLKPYGSDYFYAIHGLMLDRPYLGQKVWDLLQVLRWMASTGHESVHLVAQGWGTLPATFAALLNDSVDALTLKGGLASYQSVAISEAYSWPLSSFLPGVLESFDLPDCYRVLEKRLSLEWV